MTVAQVTVDILYDTWARLALFDAQLGSLWSYVRGGVLPWSIVDG